MSLAGNWDADITPGAGDIANFAATNSFAGFIPIIKGTDITAESGVGSSFLGITIDNSGTHKWTLARSGDGTFPRTLTLGSSGLSVVGSGTVLLGGVPTVLSTDQTWSVGTGSQVDITGSATLGGTGKLTKSGAGTLLISDASNSNNGGIDVTGGVLANGRSTNGLGANGNLVRFYSGTTYEARNANTANAQVQLFDGSTFRGTGNAGIALSTGSSLTIDSAANTTVTFETVSSGQQLNVNVGTRGGSATSTIVIKGANAAAPVLGSAGGFVNLNGGNFNTGAYSGKWKIESGILRVSALSGLGDPAAVSEPTSTVVGTGNTVELAGGTIWLAGTNSSSTAVNFKSPFIVTADSTIAIDKVASGTIVNNNDSAIGRTIGAVTIGNNTLTVTTSNNVTGVTTVNATPALSTPARVGGGLLNLTGDATINVIDPGTITDSFNLEFRVTGITQTATGQDLTKNGTGFMRVSGASSGFTGETFVNGGQLLANNATALGTGKVTTAAGAKTIFANGVASWNIKNDQAGSGLLQFEGGTVNSTLTGSQITPGGATTAGDLTVAGNLIFAKDGVEFSSLTINVFDADGVAGTDYDQLTVTGGTSAVSTALANANLVVDFTGATGDFSTATLILIDAVGKTFGDDGVFNTVNIIGASGQVNYLNNQVTLTDIVLVPEPTSLAALAVAAGALMGRRRKNVA